MLEKISFFKYVDKQKIKKIENASIIKKYKNGDLLFIEGEEPKWLHLLIKGEIRIFKTKQNGSEIFLHNILAPSFIAEIATLEGIPYPASAKFAANSEVVKIEFDFFKKECLSDENISLGMIKSLSQKLKIMNEVIHNEIILNAEAKVAKQLVENLEIFSMLKNIQIATMLNITPETLSRILSKFKKSKLIEIQKETIKIIDKKALKELYILL
ncbi:transcriptional regulator [Campylobacter sputorum subsp. bubulus]|uniref:Transcriptional regulator n=1 Tax=Campylobacter sputorum subsp. sputorum TaxID=32024 RepID=A0A381DJ00_9BACT|nr:Crp/Fnr family transcriptional regulator [Campylobacter sputorum]ASM35676.1 putative nitrosative stress-response regulator NssR, Crp/Fnr family [Campylobacter sputorum aubsp. sputorum RM3237]KAB0582594.1 Crp/Fnr family transcriptional regulator [Campylobacter sputorum subsp. sputorum]QEL05868.1 putative nitrosative stress-response regulator NssR, Crp/Fnr family [Campylobacter sputorum subsp. sputorum]SUX07905.1 transcriptional regulator [Campylobacter sputorum subsp. bubulus]SUX10646.1 tran